MELQVRERQAWRREFEKLGASRVRSEMTLGRWSREKRDAAREWLEREDIAHWQENVTIGAGPRKPLMSKKTFAIICGVTFSGMVLAGVVRSIVQIFF